MKLSIVAAVTSFPVDLLKQPDIENDLLNAYLKGRGAAVPSIATVIVGILGRKPWANNGLLRCKKPEAQRSNIFSNFIEEAVIPYGQNIKMVGNVSSYLLVA